MDSLEPQVQDSVMANGVAEASTSSPASPPTALTPALSDLSRTAEQGKDGTTPHAATGGTAVPSKKFQPVSISKKFMEQNSSTPGASQTPSSLASSKIASTTVKSPPPATSHSRLVDAKLAKLPSSSTGPPTGWTRPSSTTPSLTPSPVPGCVASVPPSAPAPASHCPPLLPHVGKVIQPQHRGAIQSPRIKPESTNGSSKPAWRNVRQSESAVTGIGVQSEFPTAAEVALGRLNGVQEKKQSTNTSATPSSSTEADTFRGVHLNPNAHHWDEMEEDNDDFLGGVIEFGDGRQYQIQPVDVPPTTQDSSRTSLPAPETSSPGRQPSSLAAGVNKEDRFSDDIDRSWPRSAGLSSNIRPRVGPPVGAVGASTSSSSSLSPQESSRMLYNWSSNHRVPPSSRDTPLHNNVQLLQKQGLDRSREVRRDTTSSQGTEDRRWERGRRPSNATTTHSAISGGRDSSRESLRQLPPHFTSVPKSLPPLSTHQLPHAHPPSSRQSLTREPWRPERSPEQSAVIPSPSDLSSHFASPTTPSVVALSPQALSAAPADIELVRKAAMHSAAERAKVRRQLEEEAREKERERARRKAAEMVESRKSAAKEETQEDPTSQETQPEPASTQNSTVPAPDRQPVSHPPSLKHASRGPQNEPTPLITSFRPQRGPPSANQPPSASSTMMSWRSNAAPLPPVSPRRLSHSPVTPHVTFPSASQVLDVQLLNPSNDESLEEVEFDDLGKFVGTEPDPENTVVPPDQQGDIPTDDQPRTRSDPEPSWRRKVSTASVEEQPSVVTSALPEVASESPAIGEVDTGPVSPSVPTTSIGTGSPPKSLAGGSLPSQTLVVPSSLPSQRSPRTTSYREELRSTFDDTMSRIKGAMQTKPHRNAMGTEHHHNRATANSTSHTTEQPRFGRGIPPSQRSHPPRVSEPDEPFTTMTELDNALTKGQPSRVKLPSLPRALEPEPLLKRELTNLKRSIPPLRWDVLSWDPPVEGMSIRDYSVNSVLFREPSSSDAPFLVKLPRPGSHLIRRSSPNTPKVHLPVKPLVNKTAITAGAFGRPRAADESASWRRTLPPIPDQVESTASSEGLVTRSGSSPPDTDKASDVTPSVESETTQSAQGPTKSRAEPRMPAGAGVAFYRESTSCPSVSFTVSSELEDARQPETPVMPPSTEELVPLSQPVGESKGNDIGDSSSLPAAREKAESKSSDGSSDAPLTPPSSTGWTKGLVKDSPVRQPDPEQLKLLWSQTSEKADVPVVNSLEGIADDLPSVPFIFQEVKSEDGETPPPTSSNGPGPSRMSLHDVTRAFQQVPPPPAGSITGKASPQSSAVQSALSGSTRHPSFPPPHAQAVHSATVGGPAYPAYHHSPMLSHSPAPTLMYPPHPMTPNPIMGGPSAQYPQPMWIPMPPPGGQTPGGPVRPLPSPYPAHASYIPYPSPGAYAASQPGPPQPPPGPPPPNGTQNRSRPGAHAGLSPNMSHSRSPATVPMYHHHHHHHQGSPVLVHPQAVMHVQSPYPGAMPPGGRGVPMQAPHPHPTPGPHGGGYTPTTHAPYARPPW